MQDRPTPEELLSYARKVLLNSILPTTPEDKRIEILMISSAMDMATRTAVRGEKPLRTELAALCRILGANESEGENLQATVLRLNRQLVTKIRAGTFDAPGPIRTEVRDHLFETVCDKLRESKPKHLKAEGLS